MAAIHHADTQGLLKGATLFDVYRPQQADASMQMGEKSPAVRLVLSGGTYAPLRLLGGLSGPPAAGNGDSTLGRDLPVHGLTQRQLDVLALLARGLPNKLIARELGLSEGTVKVHLLAIFRALDVRNRTEAVVAAQKKLQATSS